MESEIDISIFEYKADIFERFKKMCGFFENSNVEKARIFEAVEYFEKSFECFKIKNIFSFFDGNALKKFNISIDRHISSYFDESCILGTNFYAISCFEKKEFDKSDILAEFYYDLTGTAIIDVMREVFEIKFADYFKKKNCDSFVSKSFGVGFFGIEHNEIFNFFEILNCRKIGMEINEQGVIFPDKSFIGFVVVSEKEILINSDCKNCKGRNEGCIFCRNSR